MSKNNKKPLLPDQLEKLAANFGDMSSEDDYYESDYSDKDPTFSPSSESSDPDSDYDVSSQKVKLSVTSSNKQLDWAILPNVSKIINIPSVDQLPGPSNAINDLGRSTDAQINIYNQKQDRNDITILPIIQTSNTDSEGDNIPQNDLNPITNSWGPIVNDKRPTIKTFTCSPGVKPEVAGLLALSEPGDFYEAIVDHRITTMIVDQTNLYATQILGSETDVTPGSRLHEWYPTTVVEIKQFLGKRFFFMYKL